MIGARLAALCVALCSTSVFSLDTFDVVVVGSGPGGLLAAEFLSRDPNVKVLVLEAGGASLAATGNPRTANWLKSAGLSVWDVPGEYSHDANIFSPANSEYTINYVDDRKLFLAQMVGGCSSVNAALYFRVPDAYVANSQWPFDAAHVNQRYDEMESDVFGWTDLPSTDGKRYLQEAYDIVSRALKRGGYNEKSINDAEARNNKPKTFGHAPFAIKGGMRDSPAKTCWAKMQSRGNVVLRTGARVSYIKHTKGVATGVVYNDNVEVGVSSRGSVLMAAGALGTPKVLIQSGIGPSGQLNGLKNNGNVNFQGIRANAGNNGDGWIVNENVGKNLFDTTLALGSFTHNQMRAFKFGSSPSATMQQDYLNGRKGELSTSGPVLIAYDNYIVQGRLYEFQLSVHASGFNDATNNDKAFGALMLINNPESRDYTSFDVNTGKYRAFTSNSLYMATARDLAAIQDFSAKIVGMMQQEGASFVKNAQQSLNDWVKGNSGSVSNHFGGSCYVSKDSNDRSRCADEKLRVVGTSNIYVSDASAMRDGTVNPYGFIMYIGREVGNIVKSAISNGPTTPSPPPSNGGCNGYTIDKSTDYTGNDVANAKSTSSDGCCSLCSARSGCRAWTWTAHEGGTCWLKSGKGLSTVNSASISGHLAPTTTAPPPSGGCGAYSIDKATDYSGNDVANVKRSSSDGCCAACGAQNGCRAWTWTNYEGGTCWLKSGKGSTSSNSGSTSGFLLTVTSPPVPSGGKTVTSCPVLQANSDFSGADIGSVVASSPSSCCAFCQAKCGCGAFSWSNYNGGTCWLKSANGKFTQSNGITAAVLQTSTCGGIEENVDYSGGDVGSQTASKAEDCCQHCSNKSGCGAFTWTNFNGGTCWLKSGKGSASQSSGARSGVVSRVVQQHKKLKVTVHEAVHSSHHHGKAFATEHMVHINVKVHHKKSNKTN